jgi:hypothetical protein
MEIEYKKNNENSESGESEKKCSELEEKVLSENTEDERKLVLKKQEEEIKNYEKRCEILEKDVFKLQMQIRKSDDTIKKLQNLNTLNANVCFLEHSYLLIFRIKIILQVDLHYPLNLNPTGKSLSKSCFLMPFVISLKIITSSLILFNICFL